ncbi:hypothetical protein [Streptomyces sp. NPDC059080]|uniref:hypothetical protein n=1 Tax=Streptomyces sp. NPDC059080 TaxID=3346718 RepID=UPI0036AD6A55
MLGVCAGDGLRVRGALGRAVRAGHSGLGAGRSGMRSGLAGRGLRCAVRSRVALGSRRLLRAVRARRRHRRGAGRGLPGGLGDGELHGSGGRSRWLLVRGLRRTRGGLLDGGQLHGPGGTRGGGLARGLRLRLGLGLGLGLALSLRLVRGLGRGLRLGLGLVRGRLG